MSVSDRELAEAYHLDRHTVAKWRQRKGVEKMPRTAPIGSTPRSARPRRRMVVALRETLPLPLDDYPREFIQPPRSRALA